jgi:hypothetical protein
MALPVLSNARRYIVYGRNEKAVRKQLVNITLFGVPNVFVHRKVVERFKSWESSVRAYELSGVVVGGKTRRRVPEAKMFKPHRIDSFNWRTMRGSNSRSMHSWGLAVDIDPDPNDPYDTLHPIPAYVTNRAQKRGLTWGGTWKHKDRPHFEWTR